MGSRYGVRTRAREAVILKEVRANHACPQCGKKKVKRMATALWKCASCGAKFAGGSYSPTTQIGAAAKKALSGKHEKA